MLDRVSLTAEAGQLVGFVGRTGSGKSSLFSALFRLVEQLDGGAVMIDGVDIASVGLEVLRPRLAIIPQEPVIFAGTVRDNIGPPTQHQIKAAHQPHYTLNAWTVCCNGPWAHSIAPPAPRPQICSAWPQTKR